MREAPVPFVACPHCGTQLVQLPELLGVEMICHRCRGRFTMPPEIVETAELVVDPPPIPQPLNIHTTPSPSRSTAPDRTMAPTVNPFLIALFVLGGGFTLLIMLCCGLAGSNSSRVNSGPSPAAATIEKPEPPANEIEADGLVLLADTIIAQPDDFGGTITGIVVNRRRKKVDYAHISFNLYDRSGAQVGSAFDLVPNLEAGGRWRFKALCTSRFSTWKFSELKHD